VLTELVSHPEPVSFVPDPVSEPAVVAVQPVTDGAAAPYTAPSHVSADAAMAVWLKDLEREARTRLESGQTDVWDALTRQFEASLIHTALELTRGRRIEAAQKLGIGRNTITRKIQELGIDD
jgi:two-component system nitrogen regulation response regulator GlnG